MKKLVCVVGTGKMAENAGLYFLSKNADVVFVSSSVERLNEFDEIIKKKHGRLKRVNGDDVIGNYSVCSFNEISGHDISFVLECTSEDLEKKKSIVKKLRAVKVGVPILSNSSSIKPELIDSEVLGFHLFYPVELTAFVEISDDKDSQAAGLAEEFGFNFIEVKNESLFIVNRLLLPLQNEALRALTEGYGEGIVDESSACEFLMKGQLTLIDSVGIDVISESVKNYIGMMSLEEAKEYSYLKEGLLLMLENGLYGKKCGAGFMQNDSLPWIKVKGDMHPRIPFEKLFVNNCLKIIEKGIVGFNEIDLILKTVYMYDGSFKEFIEHINKEQYLRQLELLFDKTKLSYYKPAEFFKVSRDDG